MKKKLSPDIRFAEMEDGDYLKDWLNDPTSGRWFPMCNEREVEDTVRVWMSYTKLRGGITACIEGKPVGMANLYIQPFQKLSHQCLFSIIVQKEFQGQGVGEALLTRLIQLAREEHPIQILHLEVYDQNPAIHLYKKMGFVEYGRHPKFIKEETGKYVAKILMQKFLEEGSNGRT